MPYDLLTKIASATSAGFASLELRIPELREFLRERSLTDLREALSLVDARVESINALEFVTFRGDDYDAVLDECREVCAWAAALESPVVIAVPSPSPSWNTSWNTIKEESVRVLSDLAAIGDEAGVTIGFEPLGFGWCSVRTVAGACEILDELECTNVSLILDLFHFHLAGARLDELDRLDPARLAIVHVDDLEEGPLEAMTDAHRLYPGEGCMPMEAICKRLAAIGFRGVLSIELFRPEYWEMNPDCTTRRAYGSVVALAQKYFSAGASTHE
jgi:2-keto-myo-inositol isomerase